MSQSEAGPSTPRRSSPPVQAASRADDETPDLESLVTPAPSAVDLPAAPPPNPPAIDLPLNSPANMDTPTNRPPAIDIAEFDPFAASSHPAAAATDGATLGTPRDGETAASSSRSRASPAAEPAFNFSGFLKDLKSRSAEPVARYLKSFLSNFAKKPFTVNEQIKLIHDFLSFIREKMEQIEPWKSQSPAEFDNAMEAMEKLVMNRLYNYTFTPQLVPSQPITTDDLERDAVFAQRVRLFIWIREKHLDVPEGEASQGFLGFAEQELLKINHYKAPRDKMICILNSCKVIFGLIRHAYGADKTSADAFIPILIFVVLRANPENMLSNIEYISRFRSSSKLQGEAGYYLSSLTGAITFIETMDSSSLSNITQQEFEDNVESAIQGLPPSPTTHTRILSDAEMSPFAPTTPGEEPANALTLSTAAFDNTRRFIQRTSNLAQEAVSRPLSAIGKILENMQEEREDGSDVERRWEAGGERDQEAEQHHDARERLETPKKSRPVSSRTPDSPSNRYSHLGLSPGNRSPAGTPSSEIPLPDFSNLQLQSTLEESQEAYIQTRNANVQTLHQMFPDLDQEVLDAVLEGSGDDLGLAIDRLLEM